MNLEGLDRWANKDEYLYVLFTRARDRLSLLASPEALKMLKKSLGVD
jgi:ATP-dependent exoDNAse (exonuclease V) alpha subunit